MPSSGFDRSSMVAKGSLKRSILFRIIGQGIDDDCPVDDMKTAASSRFFLGFFSFIRKRLTIREEGEQGLRR